MSGIPGVIVVGSGGTTGIEVIVNGPPVEDVLRYMVNEPSAVSGQVASVTVRYFRTISQQPLYRQKAPVESTQPKLFCTLTENWWLPEVPTGKLRIGPEPTGEPKSYHVMIG